MYGPGRLLLVSKKPNIQKLIKDIETMSVDDIKKLNEKPNVIKGLIEIKELGTDKGTNAELIATAMQKHYKPDIEKPSCIYQYHGEPFWVKVNSSELQFETKWYWLELSQSEIIVSSNKIKVSNLTLSKLKESSTYISTGLLRDLQALEKYRVSKLL